jgi:hypothetical protein
LIVATQKLDRARFKGRIERRIKPVLVNWPEQKEAKKWPDGPPVYDLVRAIYGSDKGDPAKWLAQLVADGAAAQGWGHIEGTWWKRRFELDAAHADQLRQEREIMKALSKRLAQLHPKLFAELDKQIERGIKSRIKPRDDYDY